MIRFLLRKHAAQPAVAADQGPIETPLQQAEWLVKARRYNLEHIELRMQAAKNLGHELDPYEKVIERCSLELEEALRLLDVEREISRIRGRRPRSETRDPMKADG